jgi:hypothetical protein
MSVSASALASVAGIESTPNPSSFLVKLSAPLVGLEDLAGSLQGRSYSNSYSTVTLLTPTEIAEIRRIDGIEKVYCMATALTINKKSSAKWETILPIVVTALGVDIDEQLVLLQGLHVLPTSSTDASTTSSSGQVSIRLQISNKIPIQI